MKKVWSFALVLCMVLSLLIIPTVTVTAEQIQIDSAQTTVTLNGVEFKVIRTADEFKAIEGNNNYILANDIDLGGAVASGAKIFIMKSGWSGTLDGNGYSLTGYSITGGNNTGLFDFYNEKINVVIRNLTFGSSTAPITMQSGGNGGGGAVASSVDNDSTVKLENCVAYVDFGTNSDGTRETTYAQKGAFIGCINKTSNAGSVEFVNCKAYGKVSGKNKIGGFIGCNYSTSPVSFVNCTSHVDVNGTQYIGGFIGIVQAKGATTFESCANNSTLRGGDDTEVGGFIGKNTGNCVFKLCTNNCLISGGAAKTTGTLIGIHESGSLSFVLPEGTVLENGYCGSLAEDVTPTVTYFKQNNISTVNDLKAISESGSYTLTADLTLSEKVTLNLQGLDVVIDLAEKSINGQLEIAGDGKLTLSNGTLKNETAEAAITVAGKANVSLNTTTVEGKDAAIAVSGTMALTDVTVTASGNGIVCGGSGNVTLDKVTVTAAANAIVSAQAGSTADMSVTVKSGTFTSTADNAVAWGGIGKLTVEGGTFNGASEYAALAQTNGEVTVNSGTFKGKDALKLDASATATASITLTVTDGTFEGTRSALYYTGSNGDTFDVVISGGTFKGTSDGALYTDSSDASIAISAGSFDETIPTECCEQYYVSILNSESGLYEVRYHECDYTDLDWEYMNTGSHFMACKVCGEKKTEAHKWGAQQDNGDGTHSKTCSECNSKSTPQAHQTTCEDNGDGTHKSGCSICGMSENADHTFGEAKSLGDGTHEKVCSACGSKVTETCVEKDGVCESCGAEMGGGCGSAVSGGLLALLSVLTIPAVTLRKRRNKR